MQFKGKWPRDYLQKLLKKGKMKMEGRTLGTRLLKFILNNILYLLDEVFRITNICFLIHCYHHTEHTASLTLPSEIMQFAFNQGLQIS